MINSLQIEQQDASYIANTLYCLAHLIDPELAGPGYAENQLTAAQRGLLTSPPGKLITRDAKQMAARMLAVVAIIEGQLEGDAPQLGGPE